jgi:hypothetical protein
MREEIRRSRIARAILKYLCCHPAAQDTLPGIVDWWLPQQQIRSNPAMVQRTIDELAARGFVLQHRAIDARIHYRLNRRKS